MRIDLRSDTVTKPSEGMRAAMMKANVGDDVYEEDETVNELQSYSANLFGKEAALFCPSGTMTNQIAIKVHTQPGDELICADNAHVYKYEGGGVASNSGVQIKLLPGDYGKIKAHQIQESINPKDVHFPSTQLVCIENTANRGGGSCYELNEMRAIQEVCEKNGLKLHLDGARLFNAIVHKGYTTQEIGMSVDTISICLSKGLGAPVGSLLIGDKTFIHQAKRVRKVFGGGMRQAGFLAAAGIYALHHNIHRLFIDHQHASRVGDELQHIATIEQIFPIETNIVIVKLSSVLEADKLFTYFLSKEVYCGKIASDMLRMVFHLDITAKEIDRLISIIQDYSTQ